MDRLQIKEVKSPTEELEKELTDFAARNWGESIHRDLEENKLNFYDQHDFRVVGYLGGEVVGLLKVFLRVIEFEGNQLKMAGIGGVVTEEKHRRLGIMSEILKYTFEKILPTLDLDMAMLCTDIPRLGSLYAKVGFIPINRPYYFIDKNGEERMEADGMIAPLNNPKMVEKIVNSTTKLFVGRSNF